ncbi:MAG: sprT domain-containing protein [Cytophagia bacterium]|nr:MAG: sprT domain-containing protein [Runella sp.]TAG23012.1 MAG: sprT domain-containing protein [Cytophagales bacterium]TAG42064.1 MAG: sprT domain-containing protein [Cytophagia bacterium]TAG47116.1 MAG: sprT domain-containing protein [Runella slithyformis]TAG82453.1 MAG: sprT domain-containing protein [Cytophagales bacterium]
MKEILQQHVPVAALNYCHDLWLRYQFDFIATRPRRTRLGDFRAETGKRDQITVNQNLNVYSFLITYLHEVAHLEVFRTYKRRQPPHGTAWQNHFRALLVPVMNPDVFPDAVLVPLLHYARAPKASTGSHLPLMQALKAIDQPDTNLVMVSQLAEGTLFELDKKIFIRSTMRRTRIVCIEQQSQKRYTVPAHVLVQKCA